MPIINKNKSRYLAPATLRAFSARGIDAGPLDQALTFARLALKPEFSRNRY